MRAEHGDGAARDFVRGAPTYFTDTDVLTSSRYSKAPAATRRSSACDWCPVGGGPGVVQPGPVLVWSDIPTAAQLRCSRTTAASPCSVTVPTTATQHVRLPGTQLSGEHLTRGSCATRRRLDQHHRGLVQQQGLTPERRGAPPGRQLLVHRPRTGTLYEGAPARRAAQQSAGGSRHRLGQAAESRT